MRDVGEMLRVRAPGGVALLRQLVEPLGGVVADRLEHREPAVTVLVEAPDEALVDERHQSREHDGSAVAVQPLGDRLHRLDASGREDREQPERRALVLVEEALAPLDRAPQRLLPLREVAGVAAEDAGVLAQPVPQLARREQRDPGGRQLDREGQPVEPDADLGHVRGVVVGELEPRTGIACPLDEQPSCLRTSDGVRGRDVVGERQGRHGEEALAADPQAPPGS